MGVYNAEISAGSLMLPESRRIAKLLLEKPSEQRWNQALNDENLLQKKPATARRQARLIRNRLEMLDSEGWMLVAERDKELSSQLLMAAAIKHSRMLADFLRDVYGQDLRRMERSLSFRQWESFLAECVHRDTQVKSWSESTKKKLFQVIVRILAEAKFIDSTRKLNLTPPMLHPAVIAYLKQRKDASVLAVMEFVR